MVQMLWIWSVAFLEPISFEEDIIYHAIYRVHVRSSSLLCAGSAILVGYGIIPTLQDSSFGRIYAVYGGVFIALSFLWGWALDGIKPDRWDLVGAAIAVAGVCLIMFGPRKTGEVLPELATPAPSGN